MSISAIALAQNNKAKQTETTQKLATTMYLIENFYVDTVDMPKLTEEAIIAMLKSLDPHSAYIAAKDVKKANEELEGSFEGIGVTYQILRDTILVVSAVPGGPSEKVGIMAGDRIVTIDGEDAFGKKINTEYVTGHLRGKKGSKVLLGIKRGDDPELIDFEVVRDKIPLKSINSYFMIDKKIGYIKLDRFAKESVEEFEAALADLKKQGMKSLIFDLRGNGGGYLQTAFGLGNEFLGSNKTVVFTEGLKSPKQILNTDKNGDFRDGRLVVLIDEGSASASEIVSGAIQDWDRGVLIGRRSFGKGLVQQRFPLPDRSAVQLTVSRYYTPSGRCIQRAYDKGTNEYYADFAKSVIDEYDNDSSFYKINDSTPYHTAKGRVVYGGGGIYPDHIIHYKTDENVVYYNKLLNNGIMHDFVFDYVSHNGSSVKRSYPTESEYLKKYTVSDRMLEQIFAAADKKGLKRDEKCIAQYRDEIRTRIKADIGDMLYSTNAFYYLLLPFDPELKEAMSIKK